MFACSLSPRLFIEISTWFQEEVNTFVNCEVFSRRVSLEILFYHRHASIYQAIKCKVVSIVGTFLLTPLEAH